MCRGGAFYAGGHEIPCDSTAYERRRSLIVSTNLAFKDWNAVFPNATCIVTLIDRLTHHADVTLIDGDSYRRRESESEAAARRKALPS